MEAKGKNLLIWLVTAFLVGFSFLGFEKGVEGNLATIFFISSGRIRQINQR